MRTDDDNTAIICYVDADEGERYWRINRRGIIKSKALDKHVVALGDYALTVRGRYQSAVACQWPSRNIIYRDLVELWKGIRD